MSLFRSPLLLALAGVLAYRTLRGEIARRVLGKSAVQGPWMTIPGAIEEIEKLLSNQPSDDARSMLLAYRAALEERKVRHEKNFAPAAIF
jgi:hypothetical protein